MRKVKLIVHTDFYLLSDAAKPFCELNQAMKNQIMQTPIKVAKIITGIITLISSLRGSIWIKLNPEINTPPKTKVTRDATGDGFDAFL